MLVQGTEGALRTGLKDAGSCYDEADPYRVHGLNVFTEVTSLIKFRHRQTQLCCQESE